MKQRWDIFCKVVDNFGDVGVCWRLTKQLASEYPLEVRLFVDNLDTAQWIIPTLNAQLAKQTISQVQVCLWHDALAVEETAHVVIEAFACELPPQYIKAMIAHRPVWINLEYLSAEIWVETTHLMPSPHPSTGLMKYFFFPGFSPKTGGLLREKNLLSQRDDFQHHCKLQKQFLNNIGVNSPHTQTLISLFCYPDAPIHALLAQLANAPQASLCLVANTSIVAVVADFLAQPLLHIGQRYQRGQLQLQVLPFLSQSDYQQLLWACDINFVRGEDSWVSAIWAGKPLIWQPYPQPNETRMEKLNAFLDTYSQGLSCDNKNLVYEAHHLWLTGKSPCIIDYMQQLNALAEHAMMRCQQLAQQADLAEQLNVFVKALYDKTNQ